TTPLILSPQGTEFYMMFGSSPVCVQRWDATSLKMAWSSLLPKGASGSLDAPQTAFSADSLYLTLGSNLVGFGLDQGEGRLVMTNADNSFTPLATHGRSEEHTSELQSLAYLVCRLLLEKKN